jgi:hypothetical protein
MPTNEVWKPGNQQVPGRTDHSDRHENRMKLTSIPLIRMRTLARIKQKDGNLQKVQLTLYSYVYRCANEIGRACGAYGGG